MPILVVAAANSTASVLRRQVCSFCSNSPLVSCSSAPLLLAHYASCPVQGLSAKQTLRSLRNSVPVSMASSGVEASTQDSGTEDETFWDEDQATQDHLGAAFGSASIPGKPPSLASLTLAW